jgi:transcriptional antiterminator RfaH
MVAVYTQLRNEHRADDYLARQEFEDYFPRYLKRRSHARKIEMILAPLFPRYLFVTFDATAAGWRAIRSTRGADVVRNGVDPIPVSSSFVDKIRRRETPTEMS